MESELVGWAMLLALLVLLLLLLSLVVLVAVDVARAHSPTQHTQNIAIGYLHTQIVRHAPPAERVFMADQRTAPKCTTNTEHHA